MNAVIDVNAPIDVPLCPPKAWFEEVPGTPTAPPFVRDFDPRDGLIQIEMTGEHEGRFVALVAPEGEQILRTDINWQPPQSPTNYGFAHAGTTLTAEGEKLRTANIGGSINHAPPNYAMRAAVDLYANTASRVMRCKYHDVPGIGVVAVGALWPELTKRDAITAMGLAISGDWRHVASLGPGVRDLAGSQLVNAPALRPLPHGSQRHAAYRPMTFRPIAAGLSGTMDDVVFGEWVYDDNPFDDVPMRSTVGAPSVASVAVAAPSDLELRMRRIESVVSVLIEDEVADERLERDDGDDDDYSDLITEIFGCKACHGRHKDCPACHGTGMAPYDPMDDMGYDMADEFADDDEAMVAAMSAPEDTL